MVGILSSDSNNTTTTTLLILPNAFWQRKPIGGDGDRVAVGCMPRPLYFVVGRQCPKNSML